jgi:DNA-directed RNA polymerase subunit RPC12/RpoP
MLVANRAGTLQKCQRCGHREALKQREIEHVAGAAD